MFSKNCVGYICSALQYSSYIISFLVYLYLLAQDWLNLRNEIVNIKEVVIYVYDHCTIRNLKAQVIRMNVF